MTGSVARQAAGKRKVEELGEAPKSKMGKRSKSRPMQFPFSITMVGQDELANKNVVWMHAGDIKELFGDNNPKPYLQVANRIYAVVEGIGQMKGTIGLGQLQKRELASAVYEAGQRSMITVSPVEKTRIDNSPFFDKMTFTLRPTLNVGISQAVVSQNELETHFRSQFESHLFARDQRVTLIFPWGKLEATVQQTTPKASSLENGFGALTKNTVFDFEVNSASLAVVDKIYQYEIETLCFDVTVVRGNSFKNPSPQLPIRVNSTLLRSKIMESLGDEAIFPGYNLEVPHSSGWNLKLTFREAVIPSVPVEENVNELRTAPKYEKAYKIYPNILINFAFDNRDLRLTNGKAQVAKSLKARIVERIGDNPASEIKGEEQSWVRNDQLIQSIRKLGGEILLQDRLEVSVASGRFTVKVIAITDESGTPVKQNSKIASVWKIGRHTNIEVVKDRELNVNFLRDGRYHSTERAVFEVRLTDSYETSEIRLTKAQLLDIFKQYKPERFVKNQTFNAMTPDGNSIQFSVQSLDFVNPDFKRKGMAGFAKVDSSTVIDFVADQYGDLVVIDQIFAENIDSMTFGLTLTRDLSCSNWDKLPICLDNDEIGLKIRKKIEKKPFILPGYTTSLKDPSGYLIEVRFVKGSVKESSVMFNQDNQVANPKHKSAYRIGSDTSVVIERNHNVLLTKGEPSSALKLNLNVKRVEENYLTKQSADLKTSWISVEEIKQSLIDMDQHFVEEEEVTLNLSSGKFTVGIGKGRLEAASSESQNRSLHKLWRITKETEISLPPNKDLELLVVKSVKPEPIKKVVVEISTKPKPMSLMMMMMMIGGGKEEERILVKEEDLRGLFQGHRPDELLQNHKFMVKTHRREEIVMEVKELKFASGVISSSEAQVLGTVEKETEIEFIAKRATSVSIEAPIKLTGIQDPVAYFESHGIGGIEKQLDQLNRIFYMRSPALRRQAELLNLKPVRGALFYGPPGTGKTHLARLLGDVLGCNGERYQKLTAPEIKDKWHGESERKVRELFKPARDAFEKLGEKSPLFVVVIDEIDAILGVRGRSTSSVTDSIVNQFLGEMDGLNELNNILVIGLTNRKDQIDPAALRSGRLELHLEMGIPTAEGRRTIFKIHTKKIKENDRLDDSVDFDALVQRTDQFTGADIEGLVRKASEFPLKRMSSFEGSEEEMDKSPDVKISMKDFEQALEEFKQSRGIDKEPPAGMYS